MAGIEEALTYRLYELAGMASLRTHYIHWRVIDGAAESGPTQYDGDLYGLYMGLEPTEKNFLDERGLPDGNLYAIEGTNGDKKHQGATQPTSTADWTAFRDAAVATGQTEAWYRANLDLDALYTFAALNRFCGNVDVRGGDNYRYYHRPTDNRWVIIPYDLDMMALPAHHWGTVVDGVNFAGVPDQIRAITRHPALAQEFRNRARELLDLLGTRWQRHWRAGRAADRRVCADGEPDRRSADLGKRRRGPVVQPSPDPGRRGEQRTDESQEQLLPHPLHRHAGRLEWHTDHDLDTHVAGSGRGRLQRFQRIDRLPTGFYDEHLAGRQLAAQQRRPARLRLQVSRVGILLWRLRQRACAAHDTRPDLSKHANDQLRRAGEFPGQRARLHLERLQRIDQRRLDLCRHAVAHRGNPRAWRDSATSLASRANTRSSKSGLHPR